MKLTLGFSPCPNDTFIFDVLVNGRLDTGGLEFEVVMEDVETLNSWAAEGRLDITKLSYSAFLHLADTYSLLHSGSALGKGVGPLLVARDQIQLGRLSDYSIAIPGSKTTANLLLTLAYPDAQNKTEVVFSEIENRVLDGTYDAGLVIHESRFTYAERGLVKLADMGEWWEGSTGAAIPLGGIVMRKGYDRALYSKVDKLIGESLALSWKRYPELSEFVTCHAQEMEDAVMRKHIDLYVNEYTTDLGAVGSSAINTLFEKASRAGLIPETKELSIFY